MDSQGWVAVIGALVVLVGAISAAAVAVISALRTNTATVQANTVDRAVQTAVTSAKLDTVVAAVTGTGDGTIPSKP